MNLGRQIKAKCLHHSKSGFQGRVAILTERTVKLFAGKASLSGNLRHALLERKSPVRDIYPIKQRNLVFQEKEIEHIKSLGILFAVIIDLPLDGHDELRYRNTNPIIHQYILWTTTSNSPTHLIRPIKFTRQKKRITEMHAVGVKIQTIGSILQPLHI